MRTRFYQLLSSLIALLLVTQPAYAQATTSSGLVATTIPRALPHPVRAATDSASLPRIPEQPLDNWNSVDELVNYAAYTIDYFWQSEFQKAGLPYTPPRIFDYYTTPVQLGCGPTLPNNASYCPADHSITYDYAFLDAQWKEHGDFAPVTVIAHEWGHLIQAHFNLLDQQLAELQADCLAGAYTQAATAWGLVEPGDLQEGMNSLFKGGNPNTPWFAHGTPEQRVQAFEFGLNYGVAPCFQYYVNGVINNQGASNFSGAVQMLYLPVVVK